MPNENYSIDLSDPESYEHGFGTIPDKVEHIILPNGNQKRIKGTRRPNQTSRIKRKKPTHKQNKTPVNPRKASRKFQEYSSAFESENNTIEYLRYANIREQELIESVANKENRYGQNRLDNLKQQIESIQDNSQRQHQESAINDELPANWLKEFNKLPQPNAIMNQREKSALEQENDYKSHSSKKRYHELKRTIEAKKTKTPFFHPLREAYKLCENHLDELIEQNKFLEEDYAKELFDSTYIKPLEAKKEKIKKRIKKRQPRKHDRENLKLIEALKDNTSLLYEKSLKKKIGNGTIVHQYGIKAHRNRYTDLPETVGEAKKWLKDDREDGLITKDIYNARIEELGNDDLLSISARKRELWLKKAAYNGIISHYEYYETEKLLENDPQAFFERIEKLIKQHNSEPKALLWTKGRKLCNAKEAYSLFDNNKEHNIITNLALYDSPTDIEKIFQEDTTLTDWKDYLSTVHSLKEKELIKTISRKGKTTAELTEKGNGSYRLGKTPSYMIGIDLSTSILESLYFMGPKTKEEIINTFPTTESYKSMTKTIETLENMDLITKNKKKVEITLLGKTAYKDVVIRCLEDAESHKGIYNTFRNKAIELGIIERPPANEPPQHYINHSTTPDAAYTETKPPNTPSSPTKISDLVESKGISNAFTYMTESPKHRTRLKI